VPPPGKRVCTLRPDRSRITVSKADDVTVELGANGCVNGRTQYAPDNGGGWTRAFLPAEDASVGIATLTADGARYRVERWLPGGETLAKLRALRAGAEAKSCSSDANTLARLSTAQDAIRAALTDPPNERLVYECVRVQ
jgi:hypothetical protein